MKTLHVRFATYSLLWVSTAFMLASAQTIVDSKGGVLDKLAVVPFEVKGLSKEEALLLTERFAAALAESKRFEIMSQEEMNVLLKDSQFKNLEGCNYSLCLSDIGKVLGVQKVVHGSIGRRGKLYTLRIRMIEVANADIIYDERSEHSGEFDALASEAIPMQARNLGETKFESGGRWYVIGAAVLVTAGVIYTIYKAFNKNPSSEEAGGGNPPTPQ